MKTEIINDINFYHPTDLINPNYSDQYPRQMPIYLKIYLNEEPPRIIAEAQNYNVTLTPNSERYGHIRVFGLPDDVDAKKLGGYVQRKIIPMVERMASGYRSEWDGSNHVAILSHDAVDADNEVDFLVDQVPLLVQGGLVDMEDYLDAVTRMPEGDHPTGNIDGVVVTAETTDPEILEIEDAIVYDARKENWVLDGDIVEYIEKIRNACREMEE
jgi:hypothetical protein